MAATLGLAGSAAYAATKAALASFTRSWAAEYSPSGVRGRLRQSHTSLTKRIHFKNCALPSTRAEGFQRTFEHRGPRSGSRPEITSGVPIRRTGAGCEMAASALPAHGEVVDAFGVAVQVVGAGGLNHLQW